jgi:hypothetical protein
MVESAVPQDLSGALSISTMHAPHCSRPQPKRVPATEMVAQLPP